MIDVKIDLNKSLNSFSNRIKVRQGDVGEKMRITLTDNKFSLENQNNLQVKFEGNIRSGDYVEGIAFPYNDKAGEFVYQFKSEDVSIPGAYQRAFIRVYDESGNRISSEDIYVEVLKDADISNNQSKIYVSKLDELLEDFDDDFGEFLTGKEEDYSALDEKSKELNSELSDLKKGSNEIKNTQTEIIQSIEDNDLATKNDLETAKQESSANVINQIVSGKKEKIVFSPNFSGKVSGSLVENANSAYIAYSTALNAPTAGAWYEFSDERYSKISDLDDIRDVGSHKVNGQMVLIRIEYDVVDILTSVYSNNFWLSQGISTLDEKVTYIKNNVSEITPHVFGFGSGPSGNRLQLVTWRPDTKVWNDNGVTAINSTNQVKDIYAKHSPVVVDQYGKINILLYSYVSDGTIPSGTSIDYSELEIALNISANEHIESMFAANHGEKIATQEEAEAGTDNTKTMTPLRTAQQLEKKAVTIAGNQTIGGIKNFKDGLMINDVSLSTITRKVIYEADGVGGYFNAADKFTLGASGKIDKIVLLWSRVDDTAGTLLNYSWSQTVLSPDDLVVGNSYRIQMTTDNYKFVTFANESGNVTISGANENSVAPNRIYRIKRIIAYLKN